MTWHMTLMGLLELLSLDGSRFGTFSSCVNPEKPSALLHKQGASEAKPLRSAIGCTLPGSSESARLCFAVAGQRRS